MDNWGNLALESTALPAGTESRHEFLVHGIYFDGLHYGHQGRDITWSNSSLFCTRLSNRILNVIVSVIVDVIEKFYKCIAYISS